MRDNHSDLATSLPVSKWSFNEERPFFLRNKTSPSNEKKDQENSLKVQRKEKTNHSHWTYSVYSLFDRVSSHMLICWFFGSLFDMVFDLSAHSSLLQLPRFLYLLLLRLMSGKGSKDWQQGKELEWLIIHSAWHPIIPCSLLKLFKSLCCSL